MTTPQAPLESPMGNPPVPLTPEQQTLLRQYIGITHQNPLRAVVVLRQCNWSVSVAIAKFYDEGMGQDEYTPPVNIDPMRHQRPHTEAELFREPPRTPYQTLQELMMQAEENRRRQGMAGAGAAGAAEPVEHTEPARRVVPPPPTPIWRPPLVLAVLLSPLHLGYRLLFGLWRCVQYVMGLVPWFRSTTPAAASASASAWSTSTRRALAPRAAAERFKREFEEEYRTKELKFEEDGYAQVYDRAKADPAFLLVVLLSPEHEDTEPFVRETLLAPEVLALVQDPASNMLLWGGNVCDPEAMQVAQEFHVTRFPFTALVCVTPKEGSSTRMGTVSRTVGPSSPHTFVPQLRAAMRRYEAGLAAVRADRLSRESSRNIRAEQDDAYERSLARDRERAQQRHDAEAAAAAAARAAEEKEAEAARRAALREDWRRWRLSLLEPEPEPASANDTGIVRVAIKLSDARGDGARVRRAFAKGATVEDLYAFVDCYEVAQQDAAAAAAAVPSEKTVPPSKPDGYTHEYRFRIASILPREVFEPTEAKTLLEVIGRSASLVVEELDDEDTEEEEEG